MNIKPSRQENAIKVVAFAFQFQKRFTLDELHRLENMHQGEEDDLPRIQKHQGMTIQFDAGSGIQKAAPSDLAGISFERLTPSGSAEWSFHAKDQAVIIQCSKYSRWDTIWKNVTSILDRFHSCFDTDNQLISCGLEFLDEFDVIDSTQEWVTDLFDLESKHLSKGMLESSSFWHCHTGFFTPTEAVSDKILTRINIDYNRDDKSIHYVTVKIQHQITFLEPILIQHYLSKHINCNFEEMHKLNKSSLYNLLSEEMSKLIGLEVN